jgi:hypothetical protein
MNLLSCLARIILFLFPFCLQAQQYYFKDTQSYNLNAYAIGLMKHTIAPDEYFETKNCIDSVTSTNLQTRTFYFYVLRTIVPGVNHPQLKRQIGMMMNNYLNRYTKEFLAAYARLSATEKYYFDECFVKGSGKQFTRKEEVVQAFDPLCRECSKEETGALEHLKKVLADSVPKKR